MIMPKNDKQLIALSSMSVGEKALIVAFSFDTDEGERIQEMGLFPGEQVEVMRFSPLDHSVEIKIRGYFISLRQQEADRIKVKLL